jgi:hypothetical protein
MGRQHLRVQPQPLTVETTAVDRATQHEHRIAIAVVGAAAAVLPDATAEFRLHNHGNARGFTTGVEIVVERGQRFGEFGDFILIKMITAAGGALTVMRVPAAQVERRKTQPKIEADRLRDRPAGRVDV